MEHFLIQTYDDYVNTFNNKADTLISSIAKFLSINDFVIDDVDDKSVCFSSNKDCYVLELINNQIRVYNNYDADYYFDDIDKLIKYVKELKNENN